MPPEEPTEASIPPPEETTEEIPVVDLPPDEPTEASIPPPEEPTEEIPVVDLPPEEPTEASIPPPEETTEEIPVVDLPPEEPTEASIPPPEEPTEEPATEASAEAPAVAESVILLPNEHFQDETSQAMELNFDIDTFDKPILKSADFRNHRDGYRVACETEALTEHECLAIMECYWVPEVAPGFGACMKRLSDPGRRSMGKFFKPKTIY